MKTGFYTKILRKSGCRIHSLREEEVIFDAMTDHKLPHCVLYGIQIKKHDNRNYSIMGYFPLIACTVSRCILFSMTSLLTHTVAHFTRPSFRPKINNQPLKSCGQLSKSCQKWQNSDFQSQFSMPKIIQIFRFFFH